ncbi:MAG: NAD(P)/FAD-dependent oxidoreductase, partial [Actinomycetota bacterium]|nr:NAD(P)/FAD-dependent oxidoreductase [Actinomycetota bacterium]
KIYGFRLHGSDHRSVELPWGAVEKQSPHAYVAPRSELDEMLLRHAERAGAATLQRCKAVGALDDHGQVTGVSVVHDDVPKEFRAKVVIAADGASSPIGRSVGMAPAEERTSVAIRAVLTSQRPDDPFMDVHFTLRAKGGVSLPGYGWVFPMGGNLLNIGIGSLVTESKRWRLNMFQLLRDFIDSLPRSWDLQDVEGVRGSSQVKAWRLPMGFAVWPPWRPGILAVGDAAGVIEPLTGEGIGEAIRSGLAGGDAALEAIDGRGARDLSHYEDRLKEFWGRHYPLARTAVSLLGGPRMFPLVSALLGRQPIVTRAVWGIASKLSR